MMPRQKILGYKKLIYIFSLAFFIHIILRQPSSSEPFLVPEPGLEESLTHFEDHASPQLLGLNRYRNKLKDEIKAKDSDDSYTGKDLKSILIWTPTPLTKLKLGRVSFLDNDCEFTNCFITDDKNNISDFNALLFNGVDVPSLTDIPESRSSKQKYVFVSTEPAPKHMVVDQFFDNFFNWTWTYRLDSNLTWRYLTIYDLKGKEIGPSVNMIWPVSFKPIGEELKRRLISKNKAVAWLVFDCVGFRKNLALQLDLELKKFNLSVDTYGKCGKFQCGKKCFDVLAKDYFFYFAFEDSFDEDYVTENLIIGLENFAVPIVYGTANYSRFLPPGSYINARLLSPGSIAKIVDNAVRNSTSYHDFFRWRNRYSYKPTVNTKEICNVCTALNNQEMMRERSAIERFRQWWNRKRQNMYETIMILLNNGVTGFDYTQ